MVCSGRSCCALWERNLDVPPHRKGEIGDGLNRHIARAIELLRDEPLISIQNTGYFGARKPLFRKSLEKRVLNFTQEPSKETAAL